MNRKEFIAVVISAALGLSGAPVYASESAAFSDGEVQEYGAEEEKQEETNADIDGEMGSEQDESRPASTHPKTGDPYQPLLWLFMIPGSVLAVGWLRSRM